MDDTLNEWHKVSAELAALKEKELALRNAIVAEFFPDAKEGTSKAPLGTAGWTLKAVIRCNRKVDPAALQAMQKKLAMEEVNVDALFKMKPELSVTEYKRLTPKQRLVVDQIITVTPGTPSLEVVPPKK